MLKIKTGLFWACQLTATLAFAKPFDTATEFMYQNEGVKLYTTKAIYSAKWQDSLDTALKKYTGLRERPSVIEYILSKTINS